MKVFNSKLAAIGLAAFVFASCSDSNSDPADGSPAINPADLTSVKLVAQQIDNSNIANYKNTTANARKFFLTRAGEANFTTAMPTAPTKESFSKVLNLSGPAELTNQAYTISSGKDINFTGKKINGATIFVDGKCTMQYDETTQMSNTTIVLLSSATLKYNGTGDMIPSGCTVYCTNPRNVFSAKNDIKINGNFYADFRDKKSDGSKDLITGLGAIKETTPAEKDKSITPTQNITFGSGANVFIDGSIRAINLQVEDGANVYAKENLFNNDNNGNATINGNLWIGGFIKTRTLDVNGYLKAVEAVKVTNAFNVHDGANVEASYINVTNNTKDGDKVIAKGEATLSLNGTGKITIGNQNVITANNLVTDNASAGQITLAGENAVAVIKAHKFTNNSNNSQIVAFCNTRHKLYILAPVPGEL